VALAALGENKGMANESEEQAHEEGWLKLLLAKRVVPGDNQFNVERSLITKP